MSARADEIRGLLRIARLEPLTDDVIASGMSVEAIRRVALIVKALLDEDHTTLSGVMPSLELLQDGSTPPAVLASVRTLIAAAVADAIQHRLPKGRPN